MVRIQLVSLPVGMKLTLNLLLRHLLGVSWVELAHLWPLLDLKPLFLQTSRCLNGPPPGAGPNSQWLQLFIAAPLLNELLPFLFAMLQQSVAQTL